MPIPAPKTGETQDKYISRCMSWMAKDDPDRPQDQRLAICYGVWRQHGEESMHPHFQRILDLFNKRYGEEGQNKFDYFVANHYLNTSLPYDPRAQFHESFKWAKPYLYKLREDKDAKYYAINCINAIVSMNKNDYTNWDQMMKAGESMQYRPVNVNHDHSKWLPYPRTRLDYAKAEDYAVEGILRVDNRESRLQKQIEHDPSIPEKEWISHPSIEGRPNLGGRETGYHFMGIALLEKGYQLPGDPLSGIDPIIFESVGETKEVCLLIDDSKICLPSVEQTPPPVCICPECGETVNNTDNQHCNELECPKCGASMRAQPPATGGGRGQGGPPENLEQNNLEDDAMSNEAGGPLQRGGAICPSCGKIIPETVTDVTEIECPVCHTAMKPWANLTYEQAKEELPKLVDEGIAVNMEELDELFRPPFPFDPNAKFTKTTGTDLKPTILPSIEGPVKGKKIGIVEEIQIKALKTQYELTIEDMKDSHRQIVREKDEKIIELQGKLASKEKAESRNTAWKAEYERMVDENGALNNKIDKLESERVSQDKTIDSLKKLRLDDEHIIKSLEEKVGKKEAQIIALTMTANDALEKQATDSTRARNEIRERARIQEELSDLRGETAELTRKMADLAEELAKESKLRLESEKEYAKYKENKEIEMKNNNIKLEERQQELKKANYNLKVARKAMRKAGFVKLETTPPPQ